MTLDEIIARDRRDHELLKRIREHPQREVREALDEMLSTKLEDCRAAHAFYRERNDDPVLARGCVEIMETLLKLLRGEP